MTLSNELTKQVAAHIDEVRKYLHGLPADERQEILQSIESHIYDALQTRSDGEPTPALLDAVIAEMDPPESYGELPAVPKKNRLSRKPILMLSGLALAVFVAGAFLILSGIKGSSAPKNPHLGNAPETRQPTGPLITEGAGWTDYIIGKTRNELIQKLGTPQTNTPTWMMRWDKHPAVQAIISDKGVCREIRFNRGFEGQTVSGVKIGSSLQEARSALGDAELTWARTKGPCVIAEWPSKGILLYTHEARVSQIIVFNPKPKPHFRFVDDPLAHGQWISVDFISSIEAFNPRQQVWKGDFFLKELSFSPDGKTSRHWTWTKGRLVDKDSISSYTMKEMDGEDYLFIEWMSGDVVRRGLPPKYYVLKRAGLEVPRKSKLNVVAFEQGLNSLKEDDSIVLEEVLATSPHFAEGDTVTVKGQYALSSRLSADLLLLVTATQGPGRSSIAKEQKIAVKQGKGEFVLTLAIPYHGCPHLTFYDETTGDPLGGFYFGTKEQVEEIEALHKPSPPQESKRAWQQTEGYTAPNFYQFFPNDPEGGKRLDTLWKAEDKNSRSDEEVLEMVRNGLRCTKEYKTSILRWIGNRYIWNKSPQDPDAIEIMYHAADFSGENADPHGTRHYAVYFGLSVVKPKTSAILRTLVDLCMRVDDPNDLSRVAWGAASQKQELLNYLEPYLQSEDQAMQDKAIVLEQIFTGKLKAFDWAKQRTEARAAEKYSAQLEDIRAILQAGGSLERREAQRLIAKEGIALIMDASFIEAFAACADDPDAAVRNDTARLVGGRWIWGASVQPSNAIDLMLRLSKDADRNVRYNAVYHGLSVVRDKGESIIRRLLEMAFDDREPNLYGRIAWGLRHDRDATTRLLDEYIAGDNPHFTQCATEIYDDMTAPASSNRWF